MLQGKNTTSTISLDLLSFDFLACHNTYQSSSVSFSLLKLIEIDINFNSEEIIAKSDRSKDIEDKIKARKVKLSQE